MISFVIITILCNFAKLDKEIFNIFNIGFQLTDILIVFTRRRRKYRNIDIFE